jgi:hypothetical protein
MILVGVAVAVLAGWGHVLRPDLFRRAGGRHVSGPGEVVRQPVLRWTG